MVINISRTRVIYWKKTLLLPSTYRTYLHLARNNTVIVVHFSQRELLPTFLRDMLVGIVRSIIKQIDTEHHTARNTDVCVDFPCLFLELKMYVLIGIYHTQCIMNCIYVHGLDIHLQTRASLS